MTILPRKLLGDCRETLKTLPEKSVHCCITSIPYWGLRSYIPKGHPLKPLEIGCEPTFELFLQHIVEAFRAVHRVLRDDGTLFLNVGDAYAGGGNGGGGSFACDGIRAAKPGTDKNIPARTGTRGCEGTLKPKDLMMMPSRVAMALQADGWYLRSMIPWLKRNAMPESCTDRPATAVEYFFLLSKSPKYFYDRYAVMMPVSAATNPRLSQKVMDQIGSERAHAGGKTNGRTKAVGGKVVLQGEGIKSNTSFEGACSMPVSARNRRNTDWFMQTFQGLLTDEEGDPLALIVNPKGTTIQHFASYPPKLVEPCIKAGTSERGCCADCGTPWERIMSANPTDHTAEANTKYDDGTTAGRLAKLRQAACAGGQEYSSTGKTVGWRPGCECHGKLIRGKVDAAEPDRSSWNGSRFDDGRTAIIHPNIGKRSPTQCRERNIGGRDDGLGAPAQWPDRVNPNPPKADGWIYQSDLPLDQHPVKPCTVLDPFGGTSTTAEVATRLGRHSIMCELNPDYAEAAKQRDSQGGLALL